MNTRIRWTEKERSQVVQEAVKLYSLGNISYLEALRRAQNSALPISRIRTLASHSAAQPEIKLLKEAYDSYVQNLRYPKPVLPIPPIDSKSSDPSDEVLPYLESATTEELINEISRRIASSLTKAIQHEIHELEHSFKLEKHDPTYEKTGIFKKRVCIIGLLPEQEKLIDREFSSSFSLKFLGNEAARHADIPTADAYLLMKSFISHAVYGKYQKLPQHVLIDGGMSTLRMWLNTKGQDL